MFRALRAKVAEKPWLLVVFGLAIFVAFDIAFLIVATSVHV